MSGRAALAAMPAETVNGAAEGDDGDGRGKPKKARVPTSNKDMPSSRSRLAATIDSRSGTTPRAANKAPDRNATKGAAAHQPSPWIQRG